MATHSTTASRAGGDPAAYEQMNALLAQNWWAFALRGVLGIIFGLIAFFLPGVTMLVFLVGTWAIVSGGLMLSAALRLQLDHGRWWLALAGLVSVTYGVLLIAAPFIGALVLTWWLGAYAIVFGSALIAVAVKLHARQREQPHG